MYQGVQAVLRSGKNFQVPDIIAGVGPSPQNVSSSSPRVAIEVATRGLEDLQTVNRRRGSATACDSAVSLFVRS